VRKRRRPASGSAGPNPVCWHLRDETPDGYQSAGLYRIAGRRHGGIAAGGRDGGAVAPEGAARGPGQHDRARRGGHEGGGMGRLLGLRQGGRGAGQRHRDRGFLSQQGAVPPAGPVPGQPRFLRRMFRGGQEARHPRGRPHEPRFELGGGGERASRVVPEGRAGQSAAPHGGPAPLPHLHVQHVFHRLHARHHARNQFAIRRGRPLHQRLAAAGTPAGLLLRPVQAPGPGRLARVLGAVQRARCLPVEAVRRHRQGEAGGQPVLRQPGRRRALHRESETVGRGVPLVQLRQPGPRRRRHAHLGLHLARARVPGDDERPHQHQRHGHVVHRRGAVAQRREVSRGSHHVVRRNRGQRNGDLVFVHRRADGHGGKTAAGRRRAATTSTGWRATTGTSSTGAPSPTWA